MNDQDVIHRINANLPPCMMTLNGSAIEMNREEQSLKMNFTIPLEFCHSGNVVQGGFVAAMLDATMAHTVFAHFDKIVGLPTLELKISYLRPSLAGSFSVEGSIVRAGKSIVFLQGKLFNGQGELTATASSTAKSIYAKK